MTHHDDEGAMGLVLSRPSELRVADAVPDLADLPGADERRLRRRARCSPTRSSRSSSSTSRDDAVDADRRQRRLHAAAASSRWTSSRSARAARVRRLLGLGPGQLEEELEEPSWIVVAAEPDDVFAADPDELWRTVLQRKGGKYALIATMPFDPQLN